MDIGRTGKVIGLVMLSIAAIKSGAQDLAGSTHMRIVESSLSCNSNGKSFSLSFVISNESEDNLLLYGLRNGGPFPAGFPLSQTCSIKNVGTGIAFAIYKTDGKQITPTSRIIDYEGQRPVTSKVLDSALQKMHKDFVKSKIELKSKEERLFTKEIPLSDYKLQKGKYYFQMVYYTGDNTARNLKLKQVSENTEGKLFQGCTISDRIDLIIY